MARVSSYLGYTTISLGMLTKLTIYIGTLPHLNPGTLTLLLS